MFDRKFGKLYQKYGIRQSETEDLASGIKIAEDVIHDACVSIDNETEKLKCKVKGVLRCGTTIVSDSLDIVRYGQELIIMKHQLRKAKYEDQEENPVKKVSRLGYVVYNYAKTNTEAAKNGTCYIKNKLLDKLRIYKDTPKKNI